MTNAAFWIAKHALYVIMGAVVLMGMILFGAAMLGTMALISERTPWVWPTLGLCVLFWGIGRAVAGPPADG